MLNLFLDVVVIVLLRDLPLQARVVAGSEPQCRAAPTLMFILGFKKKIRMHTGTCVKKFY
jgi:hypothetical protein